MMMFLSFSERKSERERGGRGGKGEWRPNELLVYDDQIDMHVLLCYVVAAESESVKQCKFMTNNTKT